MRRSFDHFSERDRRAIKLGLIGVVAFYGIVLAGATVAVISKDHVATWVANATRATAHAAPHASDEAPITRAATK